MAVYRCRQNRSKAGNPRSHQAWGIQPIAPNGSPEAMHGDLAVPQNPITDCADIVAWFDPNAVVNCWRWFRRKSDLSAVPFGAKFQRRIRQSNGLDLDRTEARIEAFNQDRSQATCRILGKESDRDTKDKTFQASGHHHDVRHDLDEFNRLHLKPDLQRHR